jgi:hypothetical protein
MAPKDGSDKEARKNNSPQHTDKADVTIGPYRNDFFTEILLDKTKYIKNCFFYFMKKKAYFPNLASMDSAEINQWIQDLSQIVKTRICELIIYEVYIEKLRQKDYVRTIILRKSSDEDKRLAKNLSIDNLLEEKDYEKC